MTESPETLIAEGYRARREKRLENARQLFLRAIELSGDADQPLLLAQALAGAAQIHRDSGDLEASLKSYRDALAIYRAERLPLQIAHTVRHVGDVLRSAGRLSEAEPCYEEAVLIYRHSATTAPLDLANALRGFALLRGSLGDAESARLLWLDAKELYEQEAVDAGVAESERHLALLGH